MTPLRRKLIRDRWLHLIGAGAAGAVVSLLGLFWARSWLERATQLPAWVLGLCLLLLVALLGRVCWGRILAGLGLRHFLTYPPLWLAGIFGTALVLFAADWIACIREDLRLEIEAATGLSTVAQCSLVLIAIVVALRISIACITSAEWFCNRRQRRSQHDNDSTAADDSQVPSVADLVSWIANDEPVERDEDDVLGHRFVARRVAARLQETPGPSQAIVGQLGSGKTTVRKLVGAAIQGNPRLASTVRLVPIELWPYETPRAAVEAIVAVLIDALSREVNVIAVRGLSESYATAMGSAGELWTAISHLLGTQAGPTETLGRLDSIAIAINRKFVLWVEDLERFAGNTTGGSESLEDSERLSPIRALLFGLDRLQSVAVVTATTSLHVRFDLEKIARYVEELPCLPEKQAAELIATFRKCCRQKFDTIDPASSPVRHALDSLDSPDRLEYRDRFSQMEFSSISDALPALCLTPRALKQSLRSASDIWERLNGEIDLDDLLVMSIVRVTQPSAFAVVRQHIGAFRSSPATAEERVKLRKLFDSSLEALTLDPRIHKAIERVIRFVYTDNDSYHKPQGLGVFQHANYWERFLAVPSLIQTERDQTVLSVIVADDDNALLDMIEDPARADAVESFARLVSTERLTQLLVPLVRRRSKESPASWADPEPPGIVPLWRMWRHRAKRGELPATAVLRELCLAFEVSAQLNLHVAVKIERWFVNHSSVGEDLLRDGEKSLDSEAKTMLRDLVASSYVGKAQKLADALSGAQVYTLLWLFWGTTDAIASPAALFPFPRWPELAVTVLDAARVSPLEILPQVACLVTSEIPVLSHRSAIIQQYRFDPEFARTRFGSVDAVLDAFEGTAPSLWSAHPYVGAVLIAVDERRSNSNQISIQPIS